jgi:hypothetical protein
MADSGTASRRDLTTVTLGTGEEVRFPPLPWRVRNAFADLMTAQYWNALTGTIYTVIDPETKEETQAIKFADSLVDYERLLRLGVNGHDPEDEEKYPRPTPPRITDELIDVLTMPDVLAILHEVLVLNRLERQEYMLDLGKGDPSVFRAMGLQGHILEGGQRTPSVPDSTSPESADETPTT